MKKYIILFLTLLNTTFVYSDGGTTYWIKLQIITKQGKKINGYREINSLYCDIDSLKHSGRAATLIKELSFHQFGDSLIFYKDEIVYKYSLPNIDIKNKLITKKARAFLHEKRIMFGDIKQLKVLKVSPAEKGYISNELVLADTIWLKTKVIKHDSFDAFNLGMPYCLFNLFYHEQNAEIEKLVLEIKELIKKVESNSNDEKVFKSILKKIMKYKVVIIEDCTC